MKKVFHFVNPRERYVADAVIVWCFDHRFDVGFRKFLKRLAVVNADPIKVAGGAKCLASPDLPGEREFVLDQIRKSVRLHHTRRAILMLHSDCGAYGGLAAFHDDPRAEAEHHAVELQRACAELHNAIPELEILAYFVDFEAVWAVQVSPAAAGTQA